MELTRTFSMIKKIIHKISRFQNLTGLTQTFKNNQIPLEKNYVEGYISIDNPNDWQEKLFFSLLSKGKLARLHNGDTTQ